MDKRAIGVFDSGLGGLTAVRRLHALMPQENIIYFGDTGRVPYGTRGRDIITKYARQDVAFLRQFDLKSIIIACNTVSAIALDLLSKENDIPIIGTVEPACRRAMTMTQTGRVVLHRSSHPDVPALLLKVFLPQLNLQWMPQRKVPKHSRLMLPQLILPQLMLFHCLLLLWKSLHPWMHFLILLLYSL